MPAAWRGARVGTDDSGRSRGQPGQPPALDAHQPVQFQFGPFGAGSRWRAAAIAYGEPLGGIEVAIDSSSYRIGAAGGASDGDPDGPPGPVRTVPLGNTTESGNPLQ